MTIRSARGVPTSSSTPGGIAARRRHARGGSAPEQLGADEIRATPETLRRQAEVARAAGRAQLAESLERAAELAAVPDDLLLEIYTALRPGRATADELEEWADRGSRARVPTETAAFVREAAAAYAERGLLAHA